MYLPEQQMIQLEIVDHFHEYLDLIKVSDWYHIIKDLRRGFLPLIFQCLKKHLFLTPGKSTNFKILIHWSLAHLDKLQ